MSRAKESVLNELLPALDNFDLASSHLPKELESNSWAQGMQYIGQQLIVRNNKICWQGEQVCPRPVKVDD